MKNAEGLVLPQKLNGNLDLIYLTSAKGLVLPKEIGGNLYLNKSIINEMTKVNWKLLVSKAFTKVYSLCRKSIIPI